MRVSALKTDPDNHPTSAAQEKETGLRTNMGMFAEVAGWLSLDEEHLTKAQGIINADLDGVGYYAEAFSVDRDFTDCPSGLFPVE